MANTLAAHVTSCLVFLPAAAAGTPGTQRKRDNGEKRTHAHPRPYSQWQTKMSTRSCYAQQINLNCASIE